MKLEDISSATMDPSTHCPEDRYSKPAVKDESMEQPHAKDSSNAVGTEQDTIEKRPLDMSQQKKKKKSKKSKSKRGQVSTVCLY
jgi:hypothetical protein